jgi:SAM-dependent methyltransferase
MRPQPPTNVRELDIEKPNAARMYDFYLGGSHNFEPDRALASQVEQVAPFVRHIAGINRAWLRRVVDFLMDQGIRQFLDLGSGIPTVGNVHEIAQAADPSARVVYVEIEHVAVAHSQLILETNDNAVMVHADITKPGLVLSDPATQATLDFNLPIGILGVAIGHYILDDPESVFTAYRDAVAPGSYLGLSHLTDDFRDMAELTENMQRTQNAVRARSKDEIIRLFGDWELVEPGLVTTSQWRPDREIADTPVTVEQRDGLYAGVARKR